MKRDRRVFMTLDGRLFRPGKPDPNQICPRCNREMGRRTTDWRLRSDGRWEHVSPHCANPVERSRLDPKVEREEARLAVTRDGRLA